MPHADVYQGDLLAAHLSRVDEGFLLEHVAGANLGHGRLSVHLNPSDGPIKSLDLHPFFLNLMPEGARLRLLLEASGPKEDSLDLLLKTAWDAIGDVCVLPHGREALPKRVSVLPSDLSRVSFWEAFEKGVSGSVDSAVPGVQEKISSSTVAFGVKTKQVPSAILKLNPPRYPRLVQNEEFFLRMARSCGLRVNKARLVSDRLGEPGLLVERFDRVKSGPGIAKLHQEDACQLLNLPPSRKYDVSLRRIAEAVCLHATAPVVEAGRLLSLAAFSCIIGNGDLHAKNISLLWTNGVQLSPCYDLLSTLPYPLDRHMALKMDGKDDSFRSRDFESFGESFGVPASATHRMVEALCMKAEPWIDRLDEIGFDGKKTGSLKREIANRIRLLRR